LWEKNCVAKYDSNDVTNYEYNKFELMRFASMLNYLPLPAKNSWEQLRIDLNELIRSNGSGWIIIIMSVV
jgi:hypothetical protein